MPFKKNDPRINRKGRPKGSRSLSTKLREALLQYERKTGQSYQDLLIQSLLNQAITKGDVRAIREVFDRIDGKVTQGLDLSGSIDLETIDDNTKEEYIKAIAEMKERAKKKKNE